jgi:hypothetical protein
MRNEPVGVIEELRRGEADCALMGSFVCPPKRKFSLQNQCRRRQRRRGTMANMASQLKNVQIINLKDDGAEERERHDLFNMHENVI